jgi:hypothetical protein
MAIAAVEVSVEAIAAAEVSVEAIAAVEVSVEAIAAGEVAVEAIAAGEVAVEAIAATGECIFKAGGVFMRPRPHAGRVVGECDKNCSAFLVSSCMAVKWSSIVFCAVIFALHRGSEKLIAIKS